MLPQLDFFLPLFPLLSRGVNLSLSHLLSFLSPPLVFYGSQSQYQSSQSQYHSFQSQYQGSQSQYQNYRFTVTCSQHHNVASRASAKQVIFTHLNALEWRNASIGGQIGDRKMRKGRRICLPFLLGIGEMLLGIEKNKGEKKMENQSVGADFFTINSLYWEKVKRGKRKIKLLELLLPPGYGSWMHLFFTFVGPTGFRRFQLDPLFQTRFSCVFMLLSLSLHSSFVAKKFSCVFMFLSLSLHFYHFSMLFSILLFCIPQLQTNPNG